MANVTVELGRRTYDVHIGRGLLTQVGVIARQAAGADGRTAFVITDSNVGPLYAEPVRAGLKAAGYAVAEAAFPAGEPNKTLETYVGLFDQIFAAPVPPDRQSLIVALGGGVVGDMAGFVAATLLRGVRLIQAPTSLLAMVDSSVGGKTGVDHAAGKNLIGAFHQPRAVVIDIDVLRTLPAVETASGLVECVKHGVIRDAGLIDFIQEHAGLLTRLPDAKAPPASPPGGGEVCAELIERNVRIKAEVVAADEREAGVRAHLNFGHTIGHAIEAVAGQRPGAGGEYLRHGHCVALGMVAANRIAVRRKLLHTAAAIRVEELLGQLGLPTRRADLSADELLTIMRRDKKAHGGALRFVLAKALGDVDVCADVTDEEIREAVAYLGG